MLPEIIAQTDKASRLLERAQRAVANVRGLRSGDRVFTPLIVAAEFSQGTAPSANLIFNVPADADFWAYRLLFYPYCKVVDPVNETPDEVAYRSTAFAGQSFSPGVITDLVYSDYANLVDATFALIYQGKELQNIDTPISAAYCCNVEKWLVGAIWAGASQTAGGLVFDVPLFIPRGKSITCRVTPTYLGVRSIVEEIEGEIAPEEITRQHKYKIVGVLEGEKRVSAFR
jgi:hypothetical protein